ncbi:hypothetical protein [Streptomyces xanthochromogenes]|uniref:hypothetical protein n=1 Tax=Streptomyces xanthochromogenes TaxID=67384 RepID=UPI003431750E
MSLLDRATAPVRTHWRRVFLPAGVVLNSWGNSLYGTPQRNAGAALFLGGFALAFYGMRFWRSFADGWAIVKRFQLWATQRWNELKWQERWRSLRIAAWGIAVFGVILYGWKLLRHIAEEPQRVNEHFLSIPILMGAWTLLPFAAQWAEPLGQSEEQLLERMGARMWRAALGRTVGNTAGIYFAGVMTYVLIFTHRPSLLVPIAITLGAAAIASGHRTWTRLRKLSTQLSKNVRALERDLEKIRSVKHGLDEARDAAHRSWDAVELDLRTNVDTGYAILGTPPLPPEATEALKKRVAQAIEGDPAAAKTVQSNLAKIRAACIERIDSVS